MRALGLPLALLGLVAATASCGSDTGDGSTTNGTFSSASGSGGAGGQGGSGSGTGSGGEDVISNGSGGGSGECTTNGATCGEDNAGVCAGGACCAPIKACGSVCCGGTQVCAFQQCVEPGAACLDSGDCGDGAYCDLSLADPAPSTGDGAGGAGGEGAGGAGGGAIGPVCQGGVEQPKGRCLPKPPECDASNPPDASGTITCLNKCEYRPEPLPFEPELRYSWGDWPTEKHQASVMMAPVVIQLDDDNCDGIVNEKDIPEIVFTTFTSGDYHKNGTLHAISVIDGAFVEKWSVTPTDSSIDPGAQIAAGNIDGQPGNEIVVCTANGEARAYNADGTVLWTSASGTSCKMLSIADFDQDGKPEILVGSRILNGADGTNFIDGFSPANTANKVAYDLDGDGKLDIVTVGAAYRSDGTLIASSGLGGSYVAVGDFDNDGVPEVIASNSGTHSLQIWHLVDDPDGEPGAKKAEIVRSAVNINGDLDPARCADNPNGGGPPTVADFNGDGFPDVALAGGIGYAVFDGKKLMDPSVADKDTLMWVKETQDCSSRSTGSSIFDFDGDGKAEVVYADELRLHVYEGATGNDLFSICNTSGTLQEYPLVADVDNDGQADLIVASNSYGSNLYCDSDINKGLPVEERVYTSGIRVFGDANGKWVRTRRVWNQHGYHVTNVNEDGSIPAVELPNYSQPRLNNFRQNVQPLGEFSAPDLVVSLLPQCTGSYGLIGRVRNIGEASAPPNIPVSFYLGDPASGGQLLGTALTTRALYPLESQDVFLGLASPPIGVKEGTAELYARVADGDVIPPTFHECREDNNTSEAARGSCGSIK